MNNNKFCANCGGWYGLHHAETGQCPRNGMEAYEGQKQEWQTTTFIQKTTTKMKHKNTTPGETPASPDKMPKMIMDEDTAGDSCLWVNELKIATISENSEIEDSPSFEIAAEICRRYNSFPLLVEALKLAEYSLESLSDADYFYFSKSDRKALNTITAALKAAETK